MLEISLDNVGRRFDVNWIFRNLSVNLYSDQHTVIRGHNGSGKSTLLKIIAGLSTPTEGSISYSLNGKNMRIEDLYAQLSICTPYLSVPEELTLDELISFHQKMKPLSKNYTGESFADTLRIDYDPMKPLTQYSSGMKQRVKLGLAILNHTPLVLLDEPTNNLDHQGIEWYKQLIEDNKQSRLFLVCSNDIQHEYQFCDQEINIQDFKTGS